MAAMPFPVKLPFVEALGIALHRFEGGEAETRLELGDGHLNSWAVAHGGLLMTMLDVTMAHAARSLIAKAAGPATGLVTLEMKTSFMRPAQGRLRAEGRVLHRTATLAFCEGSVHDDAGELCAHATGTFKFLRGLPTRHGAVAAQPPRIPEEEP